MNPTIYLSEFAKIPEGYAFDADRTNEFVTMRVTMAFLAGFWNGWGWARVIHEYSMMPVTMAFSPVEVAT